MTPEQQHPKAVSASTKWMISHPILSRLTTLLSFAAAVYFLMDLPKSTYLLIAPLSLVSLMYVIKLSDKTPLRQLPFLKIFLIALAWAVSAVLLSALSVNRSIDLQLLAFFLALFSFMIAEILPFDIRDMQTDQQTDLLTIPNYLGVKSSIWIAMACLLLSNLSFYFAIDTAFTDPRFFSWLLSSLFLFFTLVLCRKPKADLFYSLFIESSLFLPLLFLSILD